MALLLKIAWRNIFRHKGKSLVVGTILFLGSLIMTLGNGVISGMDKGLQENIVERFTGDLVLLSTNKQANTVIFSMGGKPVEVINNYTNIKRFLQQQNYIEEFLPIAKNMATVIDENGDMNYTYLMGVKFDDYQRMFHSNVVVLEGRFLTNNERGVLATLDSRKTVYEYNNTWINPEGYPIVLSNYINIVSNIAAKDNLMESIKKKKKLSDLVNSSIADAVSNTNNLRIWTNLVVMGFSEGGSSDIRSSIKGVIKYKYLNSLWGNFNIIDIESFRESFNYTTAESGPVVISKEKEKVLSLDSDNLDQMFASDLFSTGETGKANISQVQIKKGPKKLIKDIDIDAGGYNLVFVKLKPGTDMKAGVKKLNTALSNEHMNVRAITWKQAAGQIADMATIIRAVLFGFVLFLFFVAIVIIMNTLSMAAMERVPEIGMMRAVGARAGFISVMFFYETFILAFFFGGLGILTGVITVDVFAVLKLTTTNDLLQLMFGGDTFRPILSLMDVILCIIQLTIVTGLAVIYPIRVARKITPLEAIARE